MRWRVVFEGSAEKQLGALDAAIQARIVRALAALEASGPFAASNVKALIGDGYRLRVGDWRFLFAVDRGLVLVVKIAHRREAYL